MITMQGPQGQTQQFEERERTKRRILISLGWKDVETPEPEPEQPIEPATTGSDLPEDFPGRAELIDAGLGSFEALRARGGNFDGIKGVGPATIKKINDRLAS